MPIDAVMRNLYLADDIDQPARFGTARHVRGYTSHLSTCPHRGETP